MCDPATGTITLMSTLKAAAAVSAIVVPAYMAHQQTQAQKEQAKFQEAIQRNNAIAADYAARDAIDRGGQKANRALSAGQDLKSAQEAAFASRGLSLSSGTPFAILGDTSYLSEIDAATARDNAAKEAYGHRVSQTNALAQAEVHASEADNANPALAAAGSLLSSASQFGPGLLAQGRGFLNARGAAGAGARVASASAGSTRNTGTFSNALTGGVTARSGSFGAP